ncbi:MAG: hypothetical protein IT306_30915 [Chloroflexi bacterium]|nr:hypothetical protein [Chloroflexota bacterium]
MLVTYLIPVGDAVTTLEAAPAGAATGQLPPGAVSRFESRLRFDEAPGQYRVGQMLQTYAPGAWTLSEMGKAWLSGNTGSTAAVVAVSTVVGR